MFAVNKNLCLVSLFIFFHTNIIRPTQYFSFSFGHSFYIEFVGAVVYCRCVLVVPLLLRAVVVKT